MAPSDRPHALTTYSGQLLDLEAPQAQAISIEDVAAALSKICRFGAQARSFYSVAQHAIEVAAHVPPQLKLAALHHDSHEAFACDLPTPLKKLIRTNSDVYDQLCARLDVAIGVAFGIEPLAFKDAAIKRSDEDVRVSESKGLLADGGRSIREALPHRQFLAVSPIESAGCFGRLLGPTEAQDAFLAVHHAGGDVTEAH